ncbi:hypothetical protein [Kitasatospora sp. NPDC057223]|uniref:hypothetical protein n=1 Tax=Kitasatospora sp. NPDC057223 TaxID=3346055 RepID=UPI00364541D5
MRTWLSRTAAGRGVLLAVLAVAVTTGCTSAGGLHDAGRTRAVTSPPSPPSPRLLWQAADVPQAPSGTPTPQSAPVPVPGVVADGDDIRAVDVPALLGADPALQSDERAALAGCTGCQVRPAQYRDLTGDGRDELLTAVLTPERRAFLHVYTLHERQLLPVLALQALPGFSADTVGADLLVHEPTSEATETNSTYHWNGLRMAFESRQIRATGPAADVPGCVPTPVASEPAHPSAAPRTARPGAGSGAGDAPAPSVVPGAAPAAPAVPSAAVPRSTPTGRP